MEFPIESVREVARVLVEANLGEVTLERLAADGVAGGRLSLKRAPLAPLVIESTPVSLEAEETAPVVSAGAPQSLVVSAPCVGVFRAAKTPVEVGTRVKPKQLLGAVESMRVPNEIYAPEGGVVAQILVADGQGVEWGQLLMEIAPEATK